MGMKGRGGEGLSYATARSTPLGDGADTLDTAAHHIGMAPGVCHFVSSICTNTNTDVPKEHLMFP